MKVREKDKPSAQQSRFMKLFKQLRLEIGLKDALIEIPKFNKWLSTLLRNKEKLEEIAITTVNAECPAIILNKVPEKLKDPGKFIIPCALQELDRQLGSDELVFYTEKSEKSKNKQFAHAISVIDFSKDKPFSGSITNHSDALPPSSSPVKTSDILEEFSDELTSSLKKVLITTHNLAPKVIFDHEPKQNESIHNTSITFAPRNDPLHHEFAGEIITPPSRIAKEHEEYLSLLTLLYEISTSQSPKNVHANPSLIIESRIPVEDSEPVQEEIDNISRF
ncbi:hypothetical protein Tco_0576046 [Tanacetum coccineum]